MASLVWLSGQTATAQTPPGRPSTGGPPPYYVGYPAGWNVVAVTQRGTPINSNVGPLYTYQAGDSGYRAVSSGEALQPAVGYWAYFRREVQQILSPRGACEVFFSVPGGGGCRPGQPPIPLPAGRWVMIGDPYTQDVSLDGADAAYLYDPTSQTYKQVTHLEPGQGAFAYSATGGLLTFGNYFPTRGVPAR